MPRRTLAGIALALATAAATCAALLLVACAPSGQPEPASGRIVSGIVTDRATGLPVAGARIHGSMSADFILSAPDGRFDLPDTLIELPDTRRELVVHRDGYLPMRRVVETPDVALRLFPAAPSDATARVLSPRLRAAAIGQDDDVADLRPEARTLLAAIRARAESPTLRELFEDLHGPSPDGVLAAPDSPPATIRVWRRGLDGSTASCSGRVDVIPFEQYVKGVLPHEWIPSWDEQSLEMGAVAIRTYAWWWIEAGGKYDCADLDDTTASQVYEDEFLPKTDAAVDVTAGVSIVRDGSLVFAEYSAENGDPTEFGVDEPHCAGETVFGHGRGTCQWGTSRWANAGEDYVFMSAHYYPGAEAYLPGPLYDATFAGESYPTTMTSGDEVVVWLEYVNDGRAVWDLSTTRVGTTEPRDRDSPFFKQDNWLSPSRPTAADHSDYGRGDLGRFSFVIVAPEVTEPTTFVEHFGLVQEGVTWFGPEDSLVTWTITVLPRGSSPDPMNPVHPTDPAVTGGSAELTGGCSLSAAPESRGQHTGLSRLALLGVLALAAASRGRGWSVTRLSVLVALLLAGSGCEEEHERSSSQPSRVALGGDSELIPIFERAGAEFGVPPELLATVSFAQTRLRMAQIDAGDGHGHAVPQVGIMALGLTESSEVDRAAALLGVDPFLVETEKSTNVRAAAAVLRAELEAQGIVADELSDWAGPVAAYAGTSAANEVMWRLERGWRGRDVDGAWVVATARPVGKAYDGISRQSYALGYPGASWNGAYSGNFAAGSRDAAQINYVVIHTVQGSYAGCISWFQNPDANVSAHYVVRSSDGEITQMVDDSDVAWHDGCFNSESIGIEHEGYVADPGAWYTEPMYMASAALTSWLCEQYGIPKDRDHIMGHGETPDCSDHTDPGSGWDWAHYMDLVGSGGMPTFEASAGASEYPSAMTSGDEGVAWFELTNEGNVTWGIDETRLGTQDPMDRESAFFVDGNWLGPNRPTGADHSNYGPGAVGRFTFAIRAPEVDAETVFTETFQLVQEGVAWFGPTVSMTITVKPRTPTVDPEDPVDPTDPGDPATPELPDGGKVSGGCGVVSGAGGAPSGRSSVPFALLAGCAILALGVLSRRRSR